MPSATRDGSAPHSAQALASQVCARCARPSTDSLGSPFTTTWAATQGSSLTRGGRGTVTVVPALGRSATMVLTDTYTATEAGQLPDTGAGSATGYAGLAGPLIATGAALVACARRRLPHRPRP